MASFLLKSEPTTYSWDDLVRDGKTVWDGVTNATALIAIRQMKAGDEALIYHSNAERAIMGIARIISDPYADPKKDNPRHVVVDVEAVKTLANPVTLADIKAEPALAEFALVRNSRLSTMPVSADFRAVLRSMGVK